METSTPTATVAPGDNGDDDSSNDDSSSSDEFYEKEAEGHNRKKKKSKKDYTTSIPMSNARSRIPADTPARDQITTTTPNMLGRNYIYTLPNLTDARYNLKSLSSEAISSFMYNMNSIWSKNPGAFIPAANQIEDAVAYRLLAFMASDKMLTLYLTVPNTRAFRDCATLDDFKYLSNENIRDLLRYWDRPYSMQEFILKFQALCIWNHRTNVPNPMTKQAYTLFVEDLYQHMQKLSGWSTYSQHSLIFATPRSVHS
jgi:hypothetical protein